MTRHLDVARTIEPLLARHFTALKTNRHIKSYICAERE